MPRPTYRLPLALFLFAIPIAAAVLLFRSNVAEFLDTTPPLRLKVDLSERHLYVIEDGETVQTYNIAVGMPGHPTPTGTFRTGRIVWNPGWNPPNSPWARGEKPRAPGDPKNPMRGVKIYFREPSYFIHGTNDPASIGAAASHGCIRMTESDAVALAHRIEKAGGSVPLVIEP
ncbi:MAG TPA: L,D-transpeptidase [Longimicrobiales bacterium]